MTQSDQAKQLQAALQQRLGGRVEVIDMAELQMADMTQAEREECEKDPFIKNYKDALFAAKAGDSACDPCAFIGSSKIADGLSGVLDHVQEHFHDALDRMTQSLSTKDALRFMAAYERWHSTNDLTGAPPAFVEAVNQFNKELADAPELVVFGALSRMLATIGPDQRAQRPYYALAERLYYTLSEAHFPTVVVPVEPSTDTEAVTTAASPAPAPPVAEEAQEDRQSPAVAE